MKVRTRDASLPEMKASVASIKQQLDALEECLESFEEHPIDSIDNSEHKAEKVIESYFPLIKEIAGLKGSHVHFEHKRNVQHRYPWLGDERPVLTNVGPTKIILTLTYDEGELKIARAKNPFKLTASDGSSLVVPSSMVVGEDSE